MGFRLLADAATLLHAAFVVFVMLGGLLALRWHWVAWAHLPAVAWGALVELMGWICPLTPLENALRERAGQSEYAGDFLQHYVFHALYPSVLAPTMRIGLGVLVLVVNAGVYAYLWRTRRAATGHAFPARSTR